MEDYSNSPNKVNIFDITKTNIKKINSKPIVDLNKLKPFEFWDYIGKPKYVCAPMVDQSELAFRLLTRRYGVDLAYTPMIHSVVFQNNEKYRKEWLNDINQSIESPTFMQFCGHDPEILLKAAKAVEGKCVAFDLNLGCPQGIAKRGNYGSFLLDNTELVLKIIGYLANNITHSAITCKIRLFSDLNKTYELIKDLEKAGAKVIAVHGRRKEEKGQLVKECNWDAIREIKKLSNVPIIANGGIETYSDVVKCFEETKCDAVMSSEALLEYPALFSGEELYNMDDLALEYLDISKQINNDSNYIRSHMFKFMYRALQDDPSLNQVLGKCNGVDEFISFAKMMKERRKDIPNNKKLGWYYRYRKEIGLDSTQNGGSVEKREKQIEIMRENNLMNLDENLIGDLANMFDN